MLWIIIGVAWFWCALLGASVWLNLALPKPLPDTMARHIKRMALRYDRAARLD